MRRRERKPPAMGLHIDVQHPGSEDLTERINRCGATIAFRNQQQEMDAADQDGHALTYRVGTWPGQELAAVSLRQGMDPRAAAGLLRKLADLVERHGNVLLNAGEGCEGEFIDGEPQRDLLQVEYGDDGDIVMPEIEGQDGESDLGE